MTENLIVRDPSSASVQFTDAAVAMKNSAWETAAAITQVGNADDQTQAVEAQSGIARVLKLVEGAREAAKKPALEFGRRVDAAAKLFIVELKDEELRLARLLGDFQTLELAKTRAAEAARNKALAELEREKAAALAQAQSHDELDQINDDFTNRAIDISPGLIGPAKAQGQVVSQDWEIIVTDIWTLARAHPACVKIEPRLSTIKELLKLGVKVAGVNAQPITKSSVRLPRELKPIEV